MFYVWPGQDGGPRIGETAKAIIDGCPEHCDKEVDTDDDSCVRVNEMVPRMYLAAGR